MIINKVSHDGLPSKKIKTSSCTFFFHVNGIYGSHIHFFLFVWHWILHIITQWWCTHTAIGYKIPKRTKKYRQWNWGSNCQSMISIISKTGTIQRLIDWYDIIYLLGLRHGSRCLDWTSHPFLGTWTSHPGRSCINQNSSAWTTRGFLQVRLLVTICDGAESRVQRADLLIWQTLFLLFPVSHEAELQWHAAEVAYNAKDLLGPTATLCQTDLNANNHAVNTEQWSSHSAIQPRPSSLPCLV
jgi:hypothetical protein